MINEKTTTQLKNELKEICEKYSITIVLEKYKPLSFNLKAVAKKFKFKRNDFSYNDNKLYYCQKYIGSLAFYSKEYVGKKIIEFSENEEFIKFLNETLKRRELATIREQLEATQFVCNIIRETEDKIEIILNEIERREKAQERLDQTNKEILKLQEQAGVFLFYSQLNK